ncbi:MAG: hypothetical protein ACOYOU_00890 [Kiritimatiellia bacterium]
MFGTMKKVLAVCAVMMLLAWVLAPGLNAAALGQGRDTPQRFGDYVGLTVASNVIVYAGAMVAINTGGYAVPAADTASYSVIGRAEETVDNRGVAYSATQPIKVARGIFRWANGDAATDADIGKLAYVTDDQTINKTGGGQNIIAGSIVDVDSSGVWVDTSRIGPIGAATPSSLAVSGGATVGTTLAVSGNSTLGGTTVAVTNNATVGGTIVAASTVAGSGFKIGAVAGWSGVVTNLSSMTTNVLYYSGGIITNIVRNP